MVKYVDDTSLTGFITHEDETGYRYEIAKFGNWWCKENILVLNAKRTKEIVFDFRKNPTKIQHVNIMVLMLKWSLNINTLGLTLIAI